ncbi:MAG TPA: GNAT family N-acetyltransferase [Reyranella sp.]|nr:GNAT family N-acetyltransferase [Reyranella sp.]
MAEALPITLRDAVAEDFDAIHAIYGHHVLHGLASFETEPPARTELLRRHADVVAHQLPYLVALSGAQVVGYAYAGPFRPRAAYRFTVEDSIYLAPDAIGRGIGRRLLSELIARCTAAGRRQMIAVIGDSANAGSIGLHRALGFGEPWVMVGAGFKFGRWVDVVMMQRPLGPGAGTLPPPGA